jgi:hypothetical protein
MTDWQQRVIDEKRELDAKLVKLDVFLESGAFKSLDVVDKAVLKDQRVIMFKYSCLLNIRIELFK